MSKHNPLCQQAMDIDPEVPNCICDWVDAAERDTEQRIIKLLEKEAHTGVKAIVNIEFKGLLKAIALIKQKEENK